VRPEEIDAPFASPRKFADASMRDTFAAVERGEYSGNLPLVDVQMGNDCLGREK
jgi:hypothetical protein